MEEGPNDAQEVRAWSQGREQPSQTLKCGQQQPGRQTAAGISGRGPRLDQAL